jgi:hypothetical protein
MGVSGWAADCVGISRRWLVRCAAAVQCCGQYTVGEFAAELLLGECDGRCGPAGLPGKAGLHLISFVTFLSD